MFRFLINNKKLCIVSLLTVFLSVLLLFLLFAKPFNNKYLFIDEPKPMDNELEFLYLENSSIDLGSNERVYVSFFNQDYAKNSSLTFHKEDSEEITVAPSYINDEVALFDLSFNDVMDIGKYNLDRISWSGPDCGYQIIDRPNKGYAFSVNPEKDDLNDNDLPAGIYNLNNGGNISYEDLLTSEQTQILLSQGAINLDRKHNGLTICLDPGHGGGESGAVNYNWGLYEKNINLKIAQACRDELQKYSGVRVIMTRDGDWDVGLQQRADIARDNGADLFVSFHNNSGGGSGAEVWVQYAGCTWHNEFNGIGTDIANRILDKLCNKMGLKYRGIKSDTYAGRTYPGGAIGDYYAVLYWSRYYEIPGILLEHAFIDTQPSFLANDANLVQMGIYDAISIAEYYHLDRYGPSDILSGTYSIGSALNTNKVVQIQNESIADEAKLVLSDDFSLDSQRWVIETDDNVWVKIKNINSGKYLDIYDCKVFDNAKLQQYSSNTLDNQKWKIIKVNDYYKIVSKLDTRFVVDVPAHSLDPNNTLAMYSDNGGKNQLFAFRLEVPPSDPSVKDGYYRISSKSNNNMVLDVVASSLADGAKVQTYELYKERPNQIFKIEKIGKFHKITNIVTDKVFDVEGFSKKIGTRLEQWTDTSLLNQQWSFQKTNDGKYLIYSVCNGLVLDCRGGKALSETPVDLYSFNNGDNQIWSLDLYSSDIYEDLDNLASKHLGDLDDGIYTVNSIANQNLVLDVFGGFLTDGANVQLYSNNNGDNQKWRVKHDQKGYVSICNEKSKKYLDIYGGIKREMTNVQQYSASSSLAQKWIITKEYEGCYKLQSALLPMFYLTITQENPHNETNVATAYTNKHNLQAFNFVRIDLDIPPSDPSVKEGFYKFCSFENNELCVDLSAHSLLDDAQYVLWNSSPTAMNQQFKIIKNGDYHRIQNVVSDKYLSVKDFDYTKSTVVQVSKTENLSQLWSIQVKDNKYQLINVKNGFYMTIDFDSIKSGSSIVACSNSSFKSQYWSMILVEDPFSSLDALALKHKNTIENGLYSIFSQAGNNLAIDVYAGSKSPGANVQLYTNYSRANQKWLIENGEDNYVYIKNENSGYYLDVEAGLKKNLNNVCQYSLTKNPNQKWIIIKDGDTYKIMSGSLLNLNLSAASTPARNETNICVSYSITENAQSFNFIHAEPTPPEPASGTLIVNPSRTNIEKMMNYFNRSGHTYPTYYAEHGYGGDTLWAFCDIIVSESVYEGVDPAVVFCQSMKETGWLTFRGDVSIDQCNFCGLGATGGGEPGESFNRYGKESVRMGIRAQVQHLKRYATGTLVRPGKPIDPRWDKPEPGCAPTVEQLGGHWAPSLTYGTEIVAMMRNCY